MFWYEVEYVKGKYVYVWGGKIVQFLFCNLNDYDMVLYFGVIRVDVDNNSWYEVRIEKSYVQLQKFDIIIWGCKLIIV